MKYSITFEKRMEGTSGGVVVIRLVAILASLIATAVLLLALGKGPELTFGVLKTLFITTFFTDYGIIDTVTKAIPLLLCSVAVSYAFKMKLWNIGAEGQMAMGAMAANAVVLAFPDMAPLPLIVLMALAGILGGALWGLLAAAPRALLKVNETIMTLMLNYIALGLVQFMILGPWKDPLAQGFPLAPRISENGWLPTLGRTSIHLGLALGLVMVVLYWFVIQKSKFGYEVRAIGESESAARFAGMSIVKNTLLVLGISGAIAGLAGMSELSGVAHRLEMSLTSGYGFTAIIIAWLARLHPVGLIVMSLFMAALLVGGTYVQILGLPYALATMIQGIILFFVLGFDVFTRYRIRIARKEAA